MNGRAILAGALVLAAAACADLPPKTEEQLASRTVRYLCPDGTPIIAAFDAEARSVQLTLPDRQVTLQRRASTDAFVRFGDGRTAFAASTSEAALADQIRVTHSGCRAQ